MLPSSTTKASRQGASFQVSSSSSSGPCVRSNKYFTFYLWRQLKTVTTTVCNILRVSWINLTQQLRSGFLILGVGVFLSWSLAHGKYIVSQEGEFLFYFNYICIFTYWFEYITGIFRYVVSSMIPYNFSRDFLVILPSSNGFFYFSAFCSYSRIYTHI